MCVSQNPPWKRFAINATLYNTFTYILQQDRRHGLDLDPFRDASNLPDLLGLRLLGRYTAALVRRHLPRIRRSQLLEYLGLPDLAPAEAPLDLLVPATAAAVGRLELEGRTRDVTDARRAVIEIAGTCLGHTRIARLLGITRRSVYRIRTRPLDAGLVSAIRLQVALHGQRQVDNGAFMDGERRTGR